MSSQWKAVDKSEARDQRAKERERVRLAEEEMATREKQPWLRPGAKDVADIRRGRRCLIAYSTWRSTTVPQ